MGQGWYRETYYDERTGKEGACDDEGNPMRYPNGEPVPPQTSRVVSEPGEFTLHDTSQGHCAFCGRLGCNGRCFR